MSWSQEWHLLCHCFSIYILRTVPSGYFTQKSPHGTPALRVPQATRVLVSLGAASVYVLHLWLVVSFTVSSNVMGTAGRGGQAPSTPPRGPAQGWAARGRSGKTR